MRIFALVAVALAAVARTPGVDQPIKVEVSLGDVSINKVPQKPYPSVDGIKQVFAVYDSAEMKKHTPEEFYDSTLMAELDKSGFLDNPK
jgi:hypothetical protein